ncbi:hypothetical protein ACSBR2_040818 [Camellia fascicularis]
MENMVSLARSFRLGHIDVVIQSQVTQSSNGIGKVNQKTYDVIFNSLGEGDESDNNDEQDDLLPKFCPHVDKVFMFAHALMASHMWVKALRVGLLNFVMFFVSMRLNVDSGLKHSCGVAILTPKNPRAGSNLVSDVISERVRDKPLTHPTDVVYDLKKDYGLEISH